MKNLLLLFLFFSTTSLLQAQDKQWFLNAGVGGQFNAFGESVGQIEVSPRGNQIYQVGIGRSKRMNEHWSFLQEARLQFTHLKADFSGILTLTTVDEDTRIQYDSENTVWLAQLQVPIYWQYHLNEQWSLTGGVVGNLSLFQWFKSDVTLAGLDGRDEFDGNSTVDETYGITGAQLSTELGIVYQLNERIAIRLNAQQAIVDAYFETELTEPDVSTSTFAPRLVAGVNVDFGNRRVE
jgi:hypothetical protein